MDPPRLAALLGPTNTGKTHYAVERMMAHASGMIGFPLRLLARENYDRVVAVKGKRQTALITGEEKIVPENARYYLCTVEAMPTTMPVEFLAIDEVQMSADRERGHIFTDRLLRARGLSETLFMGASTIEPIIRSLLPQCEIMRRPRFSRLSHVLPKKITRLPGRSALIAFTAAEVYGLADLIRRQYGGAAVIMGALSPRTRNAQVELYQSGEVDYLVATDAIGMGLNLDIENVIFSGLSKFDGRKRRPLEDAELAQIAGRAGRHMQDGTFTTLPPSTPGLSEQTIARIEDHNFRPIHQLFWRSQDLDFAGIKALLRSLAQKPDLVRLMPAEQALDVLCLKTLSEDSKLCQNLNTPQAVARFWSLCQTPDFQKLAPETHIELIRQLAGYLFQGKGIIPHDWMARQVSRLDNVQGDIETLMMRIAAIRTWTYLSHQSDLLEEHEHWSHVTRDLEDRLSDALHERLRQKFIDRGTTLLMRELKQKKQANVRVEHDGNVSVDGHELGQFKGLTFRLGKTVAGEDSRIYQKAAEKLMREEVFVRAKQLIAGKGSDLEISTVEGLAKAKIHWRGAAVAALSRGRDLFHPKLDLLANSLLDEESGRRVQDFLSQWLTRKLEDHLAPLYKLKVALAQKPKFDTNPDNMVLTAAARGLGFRLTEALGILMRDEIDEELRSLGQEERKSLRAYGIRFGASAVFMPILLKPEPTRLRLLLWACHHRDDKFPEPPEPGMVWLEIKPSISADFYRIAGFRMTDRRAIRLDMAERLADVVRPLGEKNKIFATTPEIMGLVGLSGDDFATVMHSIGYGRAQSGDEKEPQALHFKWQGRKNAKPEKSEFKMKRGKGAQKKKKTPKAERALDPNSPFAELAGLKKTLDRMPK